MSHAQIAIIREVQSAQVNRRGRLKASLAADKIMMGFEYVFGCWHRHVSRPFTLSGWTYEVCLGCGRKFSYNRAEIGRGFSK